MGFYQRFTIAHELAHILLIEALAHDASCLRLLKDPVVWEAVEHFCDNTAGELLMPKADVVSSLQIFGMTESGLKSIYDRYLTSYAAIFVRITRAVRGASLVLWRTYARHAQERVTLRVTKCYRSADGTWLPEGITSRYIEPDIMSMAVANGFAYHSDVKIKTQMRGAANMGIASMAPKIRHEQTLLPILDGSAVPDENRVGFEAVLFLLSTGYNDNTGQLWEQLISHLTLAE
jgi:hypothetical protein